jgi:hypothetical protein
MRAQGSFAVLFGVRRKPRARADAAHTIVSITDDGGGNALVTTAAAHGLIGDETVVLAGDSDPTYDGPHTVSADLPPTATTFVLTDPPFVGNSTGGTWALA